MTRQDTEKELTQGELKALKSALMDKQPLPLPPNSSDAEVADLHEMILELRNFALAMVEGDLSRPLGYTGYMANILKSLQANLRHFALQPRPAQRNDFIPQVDAMRELASSFNSMIQQLKDAKEQLEEANQILQIRQNPDGFKGPSIQ